jgi:hypothetical protein
MPGKQGGTAENPFVPEATKGFLFIRRRCPAERIADEYKQIHPHLHVQDHRRPAALAC